VRYKFGARTKSNQGQVAPADIFEQTKAFAEKVRAKAKELGVSVTIRTKCRQQQKGST